jgi:hypothetical protein
VMMWYGSFCPAEVRLRGTHHGQWKYIGCTDVSQLK